VTASSGPSGVAAEKVRGAAVVIAPVPGAEPGTADAVGGGDAGRDIQVLVPVAVIKDKSGDLEVGASGPQPAPGLDCSALCCARR
jgi:hypothetical protein